MASIVFDHVSKQIEGVDVVQDFSLEIHDQEFVVVVGPMGCGHTAVLRMLSGIERPSRGRILIDGTDIADLSSDDLGIALMTELDPRATVRHNIAAGLSIHHLPRTQVDQRVHQVAVALGIQELLRLRAKELTSGQRLRVIFGRAMISSPRVLLMNQPLAGFCGELKARARRELAWLHQQFKTTVLYATHDATEAMALADRLVVMRNGHVHQVGTPQIIYRQPEDRFVAGFIGHPPMNFLPAMLTQVSGALFLLPPEGRPIGLPAIMHDPLQSYIGREVLLGLRPEDVQDPAFARHDRQDWLLSATVEAVEHLGTETTLYLNAGGITMTARVHPDSRIVPQETVDLSLNMERALVFDKQTGKRIV